MYIRSLQPTLKHVVHAVRVTHGLVQAFAAINVMDIWFFPSPPSLACQCFAFRLVAEQSAHFNEQQVLPSLTQLTGYFDKLGASNKSGPFMKPNTT